MSVRNALPALLVSLLLVEQARAQADFDSLVQTPTQASASQRLGGNFTRPEDFRPLSSALSRQVATIGEVPGSFRGTRRPSQFNQGLLNLGLGLQAPIGGRAVYAGLAVPESEISVLSGMYNAVNLGLTSVRGLPGGLPAIDGFLYTPRPPTTRLQSLLNLAPVPAAPAGPELPQVAERLEERTDLRVQKVAQRGQELFKSGTREARDARTGRFPNCATCEADLAAAVQNFRRVRELDNADGISALLLAHALLDQERIMGAVVALQLGFAHDANFFEHARALPRYFGDAAGDPARSVFLDQQLRRYARISEYNPNSLPALALEAYCAWQLGDLPRARSAAEHLAELVIAAPSDDAVSLAEFAAAVDKLCGP